MNQPPTARGSWGRDGHLVELSINQLLAGELDPAEAARMEAHLAACPRCQRSFDRARAADAAFLAGPLGRPAWLAAAAAPPAPVIDLEARRTRQSWALAALAVAAAVAIVSAALLGAPRPPDAPGGPLDDGVRLKGRTWTLEVYANGPDGTRSVGSGEEVHPGERVGFRIYPRTPGHVMILGVDDRAEGYLCYPRTPEGRSSPVEAAPDGITLEQAMRLDEVLGHERLVALLCPEPFTYDEVAPLLTAQVQPAGEAPVGLLRAGCLQHEVRLLKTPREEGP